MMGSSQLSEIKSSPRDWDIVKVGKLFLIQQGKQVSKENRKGLNQYPFLRTKNVFWGQLDLSELDQMHFTEEEESRLKLRDGDLLLCEGGSVGRTAIWRGELERCYYQNHLHRLRALEGEVDPEFGMYWFWYAFEYSHIYIGRKNVTTIPNMSKSSLEELPMPQPNISEQRKIATILSIVQLAIDQQKKMITLTTELKNNLMHKLFARGAKGEPQKKTKIGLVPQSWEVVPLEKYAKISNGFAFKSEDYVKEGILLIRISNVSIGHLIDKDNKYLPKNYLEKYSEYALEEGDLILSLTRPIIKEGMKYCFIKNTHLPSLLNQRVGKFIIKDKKLQKNYLYHIVFSKFFMGELKRIAEGSNQPNVSPSKLEKILIPVPSDEAEQTEIAKILDLLSAKINNATQRKSCLEDLFRTLLYQLMTAEIRVDQVDISELIESETKMEKYTSQQAINT